MRSVVDKSLDMLHDYAIVIVLITDSIEPRKFETYGLGFFCYIFDNRNYLFSPKMEENFPSLFTFITSSDEKTLPFMQT